MPVPLMHQPEVEFAEVASKVDNPKTTFGSYLAERHWYSMTEIVARSSVVTVTKKLVLSTWVGFVTKISEFL